MASSLSSQFSHVIEHVRGAARAYSCEGDPDTAVVWDEESEITIRLSLRGDEVWLIAGSGTLVRFVATSEGEFDTEGILSAVAVTLSGQAVEYFGDRADRAGDSYVAGFMIGSPAGYSGGLTEAESRFSALISGPLRRARRLASD